MRIVERINQFFLVFSQCSHVAREEPMKPHVADPQLVVASLQLLSILSAQRHRRMVTADGVLPIVRERDRGAIRIAAKLDWFHLACPLFIGAVKRPALRRRNLRTPVAPIVAGLA